MAEREDTTASVRLTFEEAVTAFGGAGGILRCCSCPSTAQMAFRSEQGRPS